MGLKHNDVNPLAVANMRQLDFCPAHFQKVMFDLIVDQRIITDWIYENTDGRFFIGQSVKLAASSDEKHKLCVCVGFEVHAEASYFALVLNTINCYDETF